MSKQFNEPPINGSFIKESQIKAVKITQQIVPPVDSQKFSQQFILSKEENENILLNLDIVDKKLRFAAKTLTTPISFFHRSLLLEELLSIHKIFRLYDNIQDTFEFFIKALNDSSNKPSVKNNENNNLVIKISINLSKSQLIQKKIDNRIIIEIPKITEENLKKDLSGVFIKLIDTDTDFNISVDNNEENNINNNIRKSIDYYYLNINENNNNNQNNVFNIQHEKKLQGISETNISLNQRINTLQSKQNQMMKDLEVKKDVYNHKLLLLQSDIKEFNSILNSLDSSNIKVIQDKPEFLGKKKEKSENNFFKKVYEKNKLKRKGSHSSSNKENKLDNNLNNNQIINNNKEKVSEMSTNDNRNDEEIIEEENYLYESGQNDDGIIDDIQFFSAVQKAVENTPQCNNSNNNQIINNNPINNIDEDKNENIHIPDNSNVNKIDINLNNENNQIINLNENPNENNNFLIFREAGYSHYQIEKENIDFYKGNKKRTLKQY